MNPAPSAGCCWACRQSAASTRFWGAVSDSPVCPCSPTTYLSHCNRIVGLPSSTTADALLSATGKKSGLKQGAAWKMGAQRTIECRHVDGDSMKLAVQVGQGVGGQGVVRGCVHKPGVVLQSSELLHCHCVVTCTALAFG